MRDVIREEAVVEAINIVVSQYGPDILENSTELASCIEKEFDVRCEEKIVNKYINLCNKTPSIVWVEEEDYKLIYEHCAR